MNEFEINGEFNRWLENAIDLDAQVRSRLPEFKTLTDDLFQDVSSRMTIRNKARTKETLKTIVLNLWVALQNGVPLMYSRSKNNYSLPSRYGQLHFKYDRITGVFDTLDQMGMIHQMPGYRNPEDETCRRTRAFATGDLIKALIDDIPHNAETITKDPPDLTVQLKNSKKKRIDYRVTPDIVSMENFLKEYNGFIREQSIQAEISADLNLSLDNWIKLFGSFTRGKVKLHHLELSKPTKPNGARRNYNNKINCILYNHHTDNTIYYRYPTTSYRTFSTHTDSIHSYTTSITNTLRRRDIDTKAFSPGQRFLKLNDLGIERMIVELEYEQLHRVFNNSHFNQGGRFFGASHLDLNKESRKNHIHINGSSTVELDYAALHPRMLYHWENIRYTDDPYEAICDSPEERKMFKLVQLIAINEKSEKKAIQAIRDSFRKNKDIDYDLTNASLQALLNRFKEAHKPIRKYYNSGVGLQLQNLDSVISEQILKKMTEAGIPCLPVHDSYIVPEAYQGLLAETMSDTYERLVGFSPVIG